MNKEEIYIFKNELKNYNFYLKRIECLKELKKLCYHTLDGVHSTFKNGVRVARNDEEIKEHKHRIYQELDRHNRNIKTTQERIKDIHYVLNQMTPLIKEVCFRCYVNDENMGKVANEKGYSRSGLIKAIEKEMEKLKRF